MLGERQSIRCFWDEKWDKKRGQKGIIWTWGYCVSQRAFDGHAMMHKEGGARRRLRDQRRVASSAAMRPDSAF